MALPPPAGTVVGKTTLAAAVTSTQQTQISLTTTAITVGSLTTVTAKNPQWGLIIDSEIMEVIADPITGYVVTVSRGAAGTSAMLHGKGANVYAAPLKNLPAVGPLFNNAPPVRIVYETVPIGSVAYASAGTDTTPTAGTLYYASVYVAQNFVATGIGVLNGGTAATHYALNALYDAAGNLVANSAVAGTLAANTNTFQVRTFSPGPIFLPAGEYFIAYQASGTSAHLQTVPTATFLAVKTGSQVGTFGTVPASLTAVPITLTADVGPIGYIY